MDLPNGPDSAAPAPDSLPDGIALSAGLPPTLQEKLAHLPTRPGVYQYKNADGKVIYVGKAKNLRNRVRSYFQDGRPKDGKTRALVSKIADVELIVLDSEVEALIVENNLIKQLRPRYNIELKDDKSYPYIVVTDEPYPRVFPTRTVRRDGGRYFGPYTDAKMMRSALATIRDIFMVRSCSLNLTEPAVAAGKFKLCLDYYIKKCAGPCVGYQSQPAYRNTIDQVERLLAGRTRDLVRILSDEMLVKAEQMRFEEAAALRDKIAALEAYVGKQKVVTTDEADRDVLALATEGDDAVGVAFLVREGKVTGKRHLYLTNVAETGEGEALEVFVSRFYMGDTAEVPPEVLLSADVPDADALRGFLRERRGGRVDLSVPKIGDKQKLVALVQANAKFLLDELKLQRMKGQEERQIPHSVQALQRDLRLKAPPRRIECFDNSNIQGTDPVASMVCFVDGKPRKSEYRRFKIKTVVGANDFASMQEIVGRRYRRALEEATELPDLIVIDGGKGQLSAAMEVIRELNLQHIPTIGLAKKLEEVFLPGDMFSQNIPRTSSGLKLLQQIRDEAHRFAITFHRELRSKRTLQTELTEIAGVGEVKAKTLLTTFGSVRGVREASDEALTKAVGRKTAAALRAHFATEEAPDSLSAEG